MFEEYPEYSSLTRAAANRDRDEWLRIATFSADERTSIDNIPIPAAPPRDVQAVFHGVAGKDAMLAAQPLYLHALRVIKFLGIEKIGALLDFGCGWGRFTRFFLWDVAEGGLYGVDPWPKALQMARLHFPHAAFVQSDFFPPLPFRDDFFDVVFASSVFSHLPEHLALAWILELRRVLRPAGLLIATTHSISLLHMIAAMQRGDIPIASVWHQSLCNKLPHSDRVVAHHAAGEYLYLDTGGGPDILAGAYGDAFVPETHIRRIWGSFMEVADFVDDPGQLPQATFVWRRK